MKDIPVLYSDTEIYVVNKPCGIPVQGGEGISVTLLDILQRQTGAQVFPVHRLDRDTAGLLIVARSSRAAAEYSGHIAAGRLVKRYRAVCFGVPPERSASILLPAGRAGERKSARTTYLVEASTNEASLLSLELDTGRMHQIRMHLAGIGCPVIADDKYGDFRKNREIRSRLSIRKLQLAAVELTLPVRGAAKTLTIPLPDHMAACVAALGLDGGNPAKG